MTLVIDANTIWTIAIFAVAIFVAGAWLGHAIAERDQADSDDAGDTHIGLQPMVTANSRLVERQTRQLQEGATPARPTRRVRAGEPLKPSYDGRNRADGPRA